jgi:hypothetical protein
MTFKQGAILTLGGCMLFAVFMKLLDRSAGDKGRG